jgi:hypothetical protein
MNPPPLPSPQPSPDWAEYQRKTDRDHLDLLSIFHLVWGLLAVLGLLGLWAHYMIFDAVFESLPREGFHVLADPPGTNPDSAPPKRYVNFHWELFDGPLNFFYIFFAALLVAGMVLNLAAWRSLKARRHRIFTLVLAGLNCLCVPFGTVLGIFTFIVLLRPTVRDLYEQR